MVSVKDFKINDYITLKLEDGNTNIYVGEEIFNQCKFLLLDIPVEDITLLNDIKSIDEASEKLSRFLEEEEAINFEIPPETEFWAHCSNIQVWAENNYDTKLLHSNLAFPLLKNLTKRGDPIAKRVFKEEIAKRFKSGYLPVIMYIWEQGYLEYLNKEELNMVFEDSILPTNYLKGEEFWFKLGKSAYNKKDFEKAFYCYKRCIEIYPYYEPSWSFLGATCTYLGANYFQQGIIYFERALELNPNSFENLVGLGYIYSKLKKYKKAKSFCIRSIEINPNNYYPYGVLGYIYYKKRRYNRAKEAYKKALKLKPSFIIGWSTLSEIYDKKRDYLKTLKCANRALKLDPKRYSALYYKGHSLYKIGRYLMAIDIYQQALNLEKKNKNSYKIENNLIFSQLSKIYYRIKDYDKALEMSMKSLKLNPINPKKLRVWGLLNRIRGGKV